MSDPILNDPAALANLDILGAHFYGTQVKDMPYPLFMQKGAGKELWMTEVYVPNSNANSADNWPEALDVAINIHNALVEGDFNAYVWWYIRRSYCPMKEDGTISKRGYSMVHFSKFIRPGFIRVDATKNPATNVYVSAYKAGDQIVIVCVNKNTTSTTLNISIPGTKVSSFTQYTTSSSKNLNNEGCKTLSNGIFIASVAAQCVTTWVGNINATGIINTPPIKNQYDIDLFIPVKEQSEYTMFNLKGQQIVRKPKIHLSKSLRSHGAYIIKNNRPGGISHIKILEE